jgi:serine protease
MRSGHAVVCLVAVAALVSACGGSGAPASAPAPSAAATKAPPARKKTEATAETVKQNQDYLREAAARSRRARACLSFEDFKETVYREPIEGGKYIVNGDTPITNEKQLREFFERSVKPPPVGALVIAQVNGLDAKWNQELKQKLTYCVSRDFGPLYDAVVQQMASATGEWERVAAVKFVHDASQDAACTASNASVVFDVRPVDVAGEYYARAFFPNEPRAARNVLIDGSSFGLPEDDKLQLVGILRHELGHTLGFRHEHTRPESGACFEDNNWRELTAYDAFSVMHYPQCHGAGDWSLTLTEKDKSGAACVYAPAAGFTMNVSLVTPSECLVPQPPPAGPPQTQAFNAQSVASGGQSSYGPFAVAPGSILEVTLGGSAASGDPDLYVRFGSKPRLTAYDCRPYVEGPGEVCSLTVPANASQAFVMVHGYGGAASYDLQVIRVAPGPGTLSAQRAGVMP